MATSNRTSATIWTCVDCGKSLDHQMWSINGRYPICTACAYAAGFFDQLSAYWPDLSHVPEGNDIIGGPVADANLTGDDDDA